MAEQGMGNQRLAEAYLPQADAPHKRAEEVPGQPVSIYNAFLERQMVRGNNYSRDKMSYRIDLALKLSLKLFSNFGKLALKVGHALANATTKATAMKTPISQDSKAAIVEEISKDQIAEIENKYRDALIEARAFDDAATVPTAIWER